MTSERMFPVLQATDREDEKLRKALGCPKKFPWSIIAPHEKQALQNHDQTLQSLAERGGLSPCEAVAVLEDRRWQRMTDEAAILRFKELVEDPRR